MKKTDIKTGEEYVASRYADYHKYPSGNERVRVTGPAESVRNGYYPYAARSMVPVDVLDEAGEVKSHGQRQTRRIREPWADYTAHQARRRAARAEAIKAADEARDARIAIVVDLLPVLSRVGIQDSETGLLRHEVEALAPHLFNYLISNEEGDMRYLRCPLAIEVENFVLRGTAFRVQPSVLLDILE